MGLSCTVGRENLLIEDRAGIIMLSCVLHHLFRIPHLVSILHPNLSIILVSTRLVETPSHREPTSLSLITDLLLKLIARTDDSSESQANDLNCLRKKLDHLISGSRGATPRVEGGERGAEGAGQGTERGHCWS